MRRLLGLALLVILGTTAAAGCGEEEGIPIFFQSDRDGNWEIYSIWHDGTMETRVTNDPADNIYPSVSHDGARVAFIRKEGDLTDIMLLNVGGIEEPQNITNGRIGGTVESLAWFPGDEMLLLTMSTPDVEEGRPQVYSLPVTGIGADGVGLETIIQETTDPVTDAPLIFRNARIKTQGREIAVAAGPSLDSLDIRLFLADTGKFIRKIPQETFRTTGGDFEAPGAVEDYPEYDPSGRAVLFQSNVAATTNEGGMNHIWRVEADGRRPNNRTPDAAYNNTQPSWTSELDGFTIAFVSDRDGNNEIYLRSLSGTTVTRLTNNPASDTNPSWLKMAPTES